MLHREEKFKVASFEPILKILEQRGAQALPRSVTDHFYAKRDDLDVTKLVVYEDHSEIHELKHSKGSFTLTQRIAVGSKAAGKQWLADMGFTDLQHIHMDTEDYEITEGLIGLYTINDSLLSVIIDAPEREQARLQQEFGLSKDDAIERPYNVHLAET